MTGEDLKALKGMLRDVGNSHSAAPIPQSANSVILYTEQGCARHCKMLRKPDAFAIFEELKRTYFEVSNKFVVPQIVTVQGIQGYVDLKGVAWLNVDDVAFKLGISQMDFPQKWGKAITFPNTSFICWR